MFRYRDRFNVNNLLDSSLYLSGDDTLTLGDLLSGDLDPSGARLVVLSACQTEITDFEKLPEEAVDYQQASSRRACPASSARSDLSTALLMERFYLHDVRYGVDFADALHLAQQWLRSATAREWI